MKNDIEDIYPLTATQHGMLFHSLYAPESGAYVEQISCRVERVEEVRAFKEAWGMLIERHPVLRTTFHWEGLEQPMQVVHRHGSQEWQEEHDWRRLSEAEQQQGLSAFLERDRRRGFELGKAPLMRLTLMRLTEDAYQFVWSHHHLLLDGWCMPILLREVFSFYEGLLGGQQVEMVDRRPYVEYIRWLQQQPLSEAEVFWRRALKGCKGATRLMGKRGEDGEEQGQGWQYEQQEMVVSEETTTRLREVGRKHQLTMNTLVQGAWALLLSRYSGEEGVTFGTTVSGRGGGLKGVEQMIGLFINTLPVHVEVGAEQEVVEWMRGLQEQQAEMRQYEHCPLVQVQGWSEVARGEELIESLIVFENYPQDLRLEEEVGRGERGLEVRAISSVGHTNYPLTLDINPRREMVLKMTYNSQRFDDVAVGRILDHLKRLLTSIAGNPEMPLGELKMLSEAETVLLEKTINIAELERTFSF